MKKIVAVLIACVVLLPLQAQDETDSDKSALWANGYLHDFNGRIEQLAERDFINLTTYTYPNDKRVETDSRITDPKLIRALVDEIKSDVRATTLLNNRIGKDGSVTRKNTIISDSYPSITLWTEDDYGVIFGITFIANEANQFLMRSPKKKKNRRFPVDSIARRYCSTDLTKRLKEIYNQAVDTTPVSAPR